MDQCEVLTKRGARCKNEAHTVEDGVHICWSHWFRMERLGDVFPCIDGELHLIDSREDRERASRAKLEEMKRKIWEDLLGPGTWAPKDRRTRIIDALQRKAASTEFPAEREALLAKVEELKAK